MYRVFTLSVVILTLSAGGSAACVDLGPPKPEEVARARALYAAAARHELIQAKMETGSVTKPEPTADLKRDRPLTGCMRAK